MAAKQRPEGFTLEVERVLSVGQDRKTGEGIVRLVGLDGQSVALRLRPRQVRTLANGLGGLAEALRDAGKLPPK